MKRLHRSDLFSWSEFNPRLNIDFNSFVWTRPQGNVVVDPLPLSAHDAEHLRSLGGVAWVVLTNSFHLRATAELVKTFSAQVAAPRAESAAFALPVARWLRDGEWVVPGLEVVELAGSKTPGELASILEKDTLICGDLVRSHRADTLMILKPEQGLPDPQAAAAAVKRLAGRGPFRSVLVGDGFCAFRDGQALLDTLCATL